MSDARSLAALLVNAVLLEGRSLTQAQYALPPVPPRTLAAARARAYETLRHAGRLRFYVRNLAERPLKPAALAGYLLTGLYELDAGEAAEYAAVNETVAAVGREHPGAKGFINAVLRNFLRRRDALRHLAEAEDEARWNFPAWWLERLRAEYPESWEPLVQTLNGHPPMTLRVNARRGAREEYLSLLDREGLSAQPVGEMGLLLAVPMPALDLPGFAEGRVSVQDLGAQWAAPLLQARDGMRVLDACAAPGGKTAHLLERHDLDLLALDVSEERMEPLRRNLDRLGLRARTRAADAGRPAEWWDGAPFDRILLDAPCTASGVVRRHPDGKWLKRAEDAPQLAKEQSRLLEALWPLLKPGGKILYATCSLFRAENADQVARFLGRHPDARAEPVELAGAIAGQLLPAAEMDGFFYARFIKT